MDSTSTYRVELPSEYSKWWLATAIPMANIRSLDVNYQLPQLFTESNSRETLKDDVLHYWDISDKEKAKSVIRELLDGEYVGNVWQSHFQQRSCSTEHQWQERTSKESSQIAQGELQFIDSVYQQVGVAGFLAWDLSRGAYLLRQSYFLGWVSDAEFLFILNLFASRTQHNFSSWKQFTTSFIFGLHVNSYLNNNDESTGSIEQLKSHGFGLSYNNDFHNMKALFDDDVFNIPWNVDLPSLAIPDSLKATENEGSN